MATKGPKVDPLSKVIASLNPAYAGQIKLVNKDIAAIPGQVAEQKKAIEAQKVGGFRDIARSANTRGLDFWGVPIVEQNSYLGEKYLPALANMEAGANEQRGILQKLIAQLTGQQRLDAMGIRREQIGTRNQYLEAERQRAFQAQMQREQMAHSAAMAARSSAEKPDERMTAVIDAISGGMANRAGEDGNVDPATYLKAKKQALAMGVPLKTFENAFRRFVNEDHAWDYGYGKKPAPSGGAGVGVGY